MNYKGNHEFEYGFVLHYKKTHRLKELRVGNHICQPEATRHIAVQATFY